MKNIRLALTMALCPRRYKQGLVTFFAAYAHHSGDHTAGDWLESCAEALANCPAPGIGKKFVHVEVSCECGAAGYARSGKTDWKPGNVCPEQPPVPAPFYEPAAGATSGIQLPGNFNMR